MISVKEAISIITSKYPDIDIYYVEENAEIYVILYKNDGGESFYTVNKKDGSIGVIWSWDYIRLGNLKTCYTKEGI